jgi:hypothetical protein
MALTASVQVVLESVECLGEGDEISTFTGWCERRGVAGGSVGHIGDLLYLACTKSGQRRDSS